MYSRCLSAAGFCFLDSPTPTEEFCRPYGGLTRLYSRPHWDYQVPLYGDATGVGALYTPGCWCPISTVPRPVFTLQRNQRPLFLHPFHRINHSFRCSPHYGASTRVHSHSPVQSSPCPDFPNGWEFPWTLLVASYPLIAVSARTNWGMVWTLTIVIAHYSTGATSCRTLVF